MTPSQVSVMAFSMGNHLEARKSRQWRSLLWILAAAIVWWGLVTWTEALQ